MLRINDVTQIWLGIQGENQARTIEIDVSDWVEDFPDAGFSVWMTAPGGTVPQATGASYDTENQKIVWSPSSTDTYVAGEGEAEIRLSEGIVVKKTKKIRVGISGSVTGGGGSALGPDWQAYINEADRIRGLAVAAQLAAEQAQSMAETAAEETEGAADMASQSATAAAGSATEAASSASAATTKADEASQSATAAAGSASAAASSATAASNAKDTAVSAKTATETAASNATGAATAAETAKGEAEEAQAAAEQAQAAAEQAAQDAQETVQDVVDDIIDLKSALNYETALLGEPDDYHTTNLINENALTQSKMIADDGSIANAPNNTWYVTDFLDVGHEEYLYLTVKVTTINLLYCYDENQNPIGSRITKTSDRLTSHTTYYDVHLYKGTKYVRANMRTAFMGSYMLTKYFYPSTYVAAGTYATRNPSEFTVAAKAQLAYNTFRTEDGIVRNYYSSWNAVLTDGVFSLLDMPQNTVAYVNLSEINPTEIAGLPFSSGAVYVEKVGRRSYSIYRIYRNQQPWCAIGYYNGTSFVWVPSTNWQRLKIGMLGDSVTEGRVGGTSSITDKGIPYWVGYETGLPVVNLGVGNMGWASHQYLETNAYEYLQTLDLSSYKVLTFQYGLNDGDIPLGTYADTTTATIMGSVYKCLEYVYSQNPTVQVIMINPTVGSKPASFPYYNPDAHHSASDRWTFTQYFEQMKLFCDKYAIPLIDGWKGLNAWNRATLIGDNVHPTVAGYEVLGRYIAGQIKSMI